MKTNKKRGVNYLPDISEAKQGQFKHAIIVQKEIKDGGGMYCPMCLSKVSCLNNTNEGEACYSCREKHKLKIIDFPKYSSKVKTENKKIDLSYYMRESGDNNTFF